MKLLTYENERFVTFMSNNGMTTALRPKEGGYVETLTIHPNGEVTVCTRRIAWLNKMLSTYKEFEAKEIHR